MTAEQRERAEEICHSADRGGIVQADEMLRLYPGWPEKHTATSIRTALQEDPLLEGLDPDELLEVVWG